VPETSRLVPPLERLLHLKRVPMLADLPSGELAVLSEAAGERLFPGQAVVVREGDPVPAVHFVVEGSLRISRRGVPVARAGPGGALGGLAVLAREESAVTVVAEEDTLTLELDADSLAEVLEDRFPILQHVIRETSRRSLALLRRFGLDPTAGSPGIKPAEEGEIDLVDRIFFLRRMSVFERSSITALAQLGRAMVQVRFEAGTALWREGEPSPGIFLLRRGRVRASSSAGVVFHPGAGFALGALEALAETPRWYEATAETEVVALQGDVGALVDVFEDDFEMAVDYLAVIARSALRIIDWSAGRGEPLDVLD
jgi:CRP-like cAMP-binding protein